MSSAANLVGTSLEFAAFGSGPDAKPNRASAFWNTLFSQEKQNTRVYRNSVTRVTSNQFAWIRSIWPGSGPDLKHSRVSAFRFFLSRTMVFTAVRTHFPKKKQTCYVS